MTENHDPGCESGSDSDQKVPSDVAEYDPSNFENALKAFRWFLAEQGHPTNIFWVFRDDIWQRPASLELRFPSLKKNLVLAQKVFDEGTRKGLVSVHAIATAGDMVAASVWFPKFDGEEVQGWHRGLKFSIAEPLPVANLVGPLRWSFFRLKPQFRHYQRFEGLVGTRAWAAA